MRVVYLLLVFQVHAWLQCDKTTIHTTIGREIHLLCSYNSKQFVFSKKYWCFGESRSTCETFSWRILDADIMFRVNVVVTEEAVSKPNVWLDGSPVVTCQGQPVLLRCRTERGTNVQYSWSREAQSQDVLLESSIDLLLRCASLTEDARYICSAQNTVSSEQSQIISLRLLQAGQENCVYFLMSDELESYDCRTMTASPGTSTSTVVEVSSSKFATQNRSGGNQSLCSNQTQNWEDNYSHRLWPGVPLWYDVVRWLLFIATVTSIGLFCACTKSSKRATTTKRDDKKRCFSSQI